MATLSNYQQPVPQDTLSSNEHKQAISQHLAKLRSQSDHAVHLQSISQRDPRQKRERFSWTGFSDKTLWDWLHLLAVLAVPLAVAFGTTYFAYQQAQLSDIQQQHEIDAANIQHQRDVDAAKLQHQETILKSYQDELNDLMLNRGLITSKSNDEVRVIARTEVLSALRQLDSIRNRAFLQFLQDARLIGADYNNMDKLLSYHNIVSLQQGDLTNSSLKFTRLSGTILTGALLNYADLTDADLRDVNLSGANLENANLSGARLNNTNLRNTGMLRANLSGAFLIGADLSSNEMYYTDLSYTNLSDANLSGDKLYYVNLSHSDLTNTDLSGVDLTRTNITQNQINQAVTCQETITPKGITHSQAPCHRFSYVL